MEDNFQSEQNASLPSDIVKIKIIGVGGGGCNAVNRLVAAEVEGVEFIAANTDLMALNTVKADRKIQLGAKLTHGRGAGSNPSIGEQAALESKEEIKEALKDATLVFVTAGMGGGTGTGGAPIVAAIAKDLGILTVAVVTKPFLTDGAKKMQVAELGIEKLRKSVDVLIAIPNSKAAESVPKGTPMLKIMQVADSVLHNCIVGITEIVVHPYLINLDFADIETVIKDRGTAHIGIGKAKGEKRVMSALIQAASSPLLETNIQGATQLIVSIVADINIGGDKVDEALRLINKVAAPDANIITGMGFDENLKDEVMITVIATGFGDGDKNTLLHSQNIPVEKTPVEDNDDKMEDYLRDILNQNVVEYDENGAVKEKDYYSAAKAAAQQQAATPKAPVRHVAEEVVYESEIPSFLQRLRNKK